MSEVKLLPCPFCGGEANVSYNTKFGFVPWCNNEECILNESTKGYKTEEAIKLWNTRKPMERIIERLEKLPHAEDDCFMWLEDAKQVVKEEGGIE